MELYFMLYLWGFDQNQLSILTIAGIICTFLGVGLASPVAKWLGKKRAAIWMFAGAVITGLGPIFLLTST
jgi:Na+/melibiose symporter-like transporter